MASRMLQPLRLGRPLPYGPLYRVSAPARPYPAQLRVQGAGVRSSSLPAGVVTSPPSVRAPGARAFSSAGPVYRSKSPQDRERNAEAQPKERRHIDKRRVILSWLPPGRPVKLLFKNGEAARVAQEAYGSRAVTVLGQPVAATKPRHGIKPFGWTVLLYGVPDAATKGDVIAGFARGTRPDNVDLGDKMPETDVDDMVERLKKDVADFGPLVKWQYPLPTSRRTKAMALFEDPLAAAEAAKALHGKRLEFKNGTHAQLAAEIRTAIQLRIPALQYKATQAVIEEAMVSWKQKHVSFLTKATEDKHIIFSFAGNDSQYQTLLDAVEAVENILEGHLVVSEDGKPLWHPAFDRNWPWYDKIKGVENELPVYIVRSRLKAELRVSGPWDECQLAMRRIAAIAAEAGPGGEPPSHDKAAPFY